MHAVGTRWWSAWNRRTGSPAPRARCTAGNNRVCPRCSFCLIMFLLMLDVVFLQDSAHVSDGIWSHMYYDLKRISVLMILGYSIICSASVSIFRAACQSGSFALALVSAALKRQRKAQAPTQAGFARKAPCADAHVFIDAITARAFCNNSYAAFACCCLCLRCQLITISDRS